METELENGGLTLEKNDDRKIIFDSREDCGCEVSESCDCIRDFFDNECANLNIPTEGNIVAIANLGFWNGRTSGYKTMGSNVRVIMDYHGCDDVKIFMEGDEIRANAYHHDGTHYILFREVTDEDAFSEISDRIASGKVSIDNLEDAVADCTKSIAPYVKDVYGW